MGALNMYSTTRGVITPEAPLIAKALAAQVAGALASFREIENLHAAMATRQTIGVAIGLLMAQHQLTETAGSRSSGGAPPTPTSNSETSRRS